jgi:hypothetical protein
LKHPVTHRCLKLSLFIFVACAITGCLVTHWDGYCDWTFKVTVYDQDTLAPIANAAVSIIVKNETPFGDIESFVQEKEPKKCITNLKGECELTMRFNTYGTRSLLKSDAFINFRHRNLVVEAEGYRTLNVPLKTFIETLQKLPPLEERGQPSEIKVEINKEEKAEENL